MTLVSWIMLAFLIVFLASVKWSCDNAGMFPGAPDECGSLPVAGPTTSERNMAEVQAQAMARYYDGQWWSESAGMPRQEVSDNTPLSQMR